jgi:DNA-binding response OmpR family regulator
MLKILAVDDDKGMTDLYESIFSEEGYEILTAPDSNAARAILSDYKPDLLILDAEMPGGGGERVFKTVRASQGSPVPVIFVTGKPDLVIDFALLQTKVRIFGKPVKCEDLVAAVQELCGPK